MIKQEAFIQSLTVHEVVGTPFITQTSAIATWQAPEWAQDLYAATWGNPDAASNQVIKQWEGKSYDGCKLPDFEIFQHPISDITLLVREEYKRIYRYVRADTQFKRLVDQDGPPPAKKSKPSEGRKKGLITLGHPGIGADLYLATVLVRSLRISGKSLSLYYFLICALMEQWDVALVRGAQRYLYFDGNGVTGLMVEDLDCREHPFGFLVLLDTWNGYAFPLQLRTPEVNGYIVHATSPQAGNWSWGKDERQPPL